MCDFEFEPQAFSSSFKKFEISAYEIKASRPIESTTSAVRGTVIILDSNSRGLGGAIDRLAKLLT